MDTSYSFEKVKSSTFSTKNLLIGLAIVVLLLLSIRSKSKSNRNRRYRSSSSRSHSNNYSSRISSLTSSRLSYIPNKLSRSSITSNLSKLSRKFKKHLSSEKKSRTHNNSRVNSSNSIRVNSPNTTYVINCKSKKHRTRHNNKIISVEMDKLIQKIMKTHSKKINRSDSLKSDLSVNKSVNRLINKPTDKSSNKLTKNIEHMSRSNNNDPVGISNNKFGYINESNLDNYGLN